MNSILIPTDYQYDTLHALEMTWRSGGVSPVQVVLLSFSPVPDSITDYLLIPSRTTEIEGRKKIMDEWKLMKSLIDNPVQVREHHQYGASAPIIEQIVERYEIGHIIIPYSFQKSESIVHLTAMSAFRKNKYKVTLMPEQNSTVSFVVEERKTTSKKLRELVEG